MHNAIITTTDHFALFFLMNKIFLQSGGNGKEEGERRIESARKKRKWFHGRMKCWVEVYLMVYARPTIRIIKLNYTFS
jgi:hypothetical protein